MAGDEFRGEMRVRVGTAGAEYRGALRIKEADAARRRIVVHATGSEIRDRSHASATVTALLTASGEGTAVTLDTDLAIDGRLAQFGSGVMSDVAAGLVKQFARRLQEAAAVAPVRAGDEPPARAPEPEQPVEDGPGAEGPTSAPPGRRARPWLPAAVVALLGAMAMAPKRRWRWALAAVGAALVVAGQRRSSST